MEARVTVEHERIVALEAQLAAARDQLSGLQARVDAQQAGPRRTRSARLRGSAGLVLSAVLLASLLVFALGRSAFAAHDGAQGVIRGCVNAQGMLRVLVQANQVCTGSSMPLNWNRVGPQGPVGPQTTDAIRSCPNCDLQGVALALAYLPHANLAGANIVNDSLGAADLTGANLTGANLSGDFMAWTIFTGANLTNANLTGAELANANLMNANLTGATVTRVHYQHTTCPDGSNSDTDGGACAGHGGGL